MVLLRLMRERKGTNQRLTHRIRVVYRRSSLLPSVAVKGAEDRESGGGEDPPFGRQN